MAFQKTAPRQWDMGFAMLSYLGSLLTQVLLVGGINPYFSYCVSSQNFLCWGFAPNVQRRNTANSATQRNKSSIITPLNSHLSIHSFSFQTLGKSFANALVSLICKMKIVQYIFYQHTWVTSAEKNTLQNCLCWKGCLKVTNSNSNTINRDSYSQISCSEPDLFTLLISN